MSCVMSLMLLNPKSQTLNPKQPLKSCMSQSGFALQIPKQWWVPDVANSARTTDNSRREISLKEVLELQLKADPHTVWLPKYLLVVYQLSM